MNTNTHIASFLQTLRDKPIALVHGLSFVGSIMLDNSSPCQAYVPESGEYRKMGLYKLARLLVYLIHARITRRNAVVH
jgi:hypothetical protein